MSVTIFHNPRCSKSRQTLEILTAAGVTPDVIEYLRDAPSADTIADLASKLGVTVADILRTGEAEYKEADDLPPLGDDAALAAWIAAHPKTLQRPIVVNNATGAAVIGRPPEDVLKIIGQ